MLINIINIATTKTAAHELILVNFKAFWSTACKKMLVNDANNVCIGYCCVVWYILFAVDFELIWFAFFCGIWCDFSFFFLVLRTCCFSSMVSFSIVFFLFSFFVLSGCRCLVLLACADNSYDIVFLRGVTWLFCTDQRKYSERH